MDELGFTLAGFAVLGVLHYAVAIVFAVSEYRKWRPTGWIIPLAVVMFVAFSFIFPVVEHIVRPRMRACGVDRRIIRLKLVLAWSVPLLTSVGIKLCELFCNRVVPRDVSGELALCCCLSCGLLYLVLMLRVNVKLNALAEACPAKGAE